LHLDCVLFDNHRKRLHGNISRQRLRLPVLQVEARSVARTLDRAVALVQLALNEGTVVVRAAVLDRVNRARAVEDADLEVLPLEQPHIARLELGHRAYLDEGLLWHLVVSPSGLIEFPMLAPATPGWHLRQILHWRRIRPWRSGE